MKKFNFLVAAVALFFAQNSQAQLTVPVSGGVPQAFPYSSIVRDANGDVLANRFIALRISMHVGSPTGAVAYMERDTVTTSPAGIFSVVVGGGSILQGSFDSIPWSTGQIYQQVELDDRGGDRFIDMGTAQLLSLPYAIAAGNGVKSVTYDQTGKLAVKSADGTGTIISEKATWMAGGNAGITTNDFIGTTDNADMVFKRNNSEGLRLRTGDAVTMPGKLGIGAAATSPLAALEVDGALALRETTIYASANYFNVNVGNRSLIFINSTYSGAVPILGPGLVKGQVLMISVIAGSSNGSVKFVNNPNFNTRISYSGGGIANSNSSTSRTYTDGNTITFLWNGTDWVQIASSYMD
jgi:hypothetical protein